MKAGRELLPLTVGIIAILSSLGCGGGRDAPGSEPIVLDLPLDSILAVQASFVLHESDADPLGYPMVAAIGPEGNLAIADLKMKRVVIFDPTGRRLQQLGARGRGPGEYVFPVFVATLDSMLYVTDINQGRLIRFHWQNLQYDSMQSISAPVGLLAVVPLSRDTFAIFGQDRSPSSSDTAAGGVLWESRTGQIARMAPLPKHLAGRALAGAFSGTGTVHKREIFAAMNGGNTIFRYDHAGQVLDSIVLPARVRRPIILPKLGSVLGGLPEEARILGSFQWIRSIGVIRDWIVLDLQDSARVTGEEFHSLLLVSRRAGNAMWKTTTCNCRLLGTSADDVYLAEDSTAPPWRVSRRRVAIP